MSDEEEAKTHAVYKDRGEAPLAGIGMGLFLVFATAYVFSHPESLANDRPIVPWMLAAAGIVGVGMVIRNALLFWGLKVRKLDMDGSKAWVADASASGCVGILKWGGMGALGYWAYTFVTGPFAGLELGTKVIATLLAANAALLFGLLHNTDKIINRLNR